MTSDYRILQQGINSVGDYQRLQQEFELKKQAAQSGGNLPAAIQIANEIQKRRAANDTEGATLLENSAKIYDKGIQYDPSTGRYVDMRGYGAALGNLKYGENYGGETATQQVRSAYEPGRAEDIATRQANVSLQYEPVEAARTSTMKAEADRAQEALAGFDKAGLAYQETKKILAGLKSQDGKALDPGVSGVVGVRNPLKGALPLGINIPGLSAAGGQAKIDQLGGRAFLEAFETLKGGGQITEIEGAKATAAKIRLGQAQNEKDFLEALNDFEYEVDQLYQLAERKKQAAQQYVSGLSGGQYQPVSGGPTPGTVDEGMMYLGGDPGDEKSWKRVK